MSSAATRAISCVRASLAAIHQASGSCSCHPGPGETLRSCERAMATGLPCWSKARALHAVVDASSATTNGPCRELRIAERDMTSHTEDARAPDTGPLRGPMMRSRSGSGDEQVGETRPARAGTPGALGRLDSRRRRRLPGHLADGHRKRMAWNGRTHRACETGACSADPHADGQTVTAAPWSTAVRRHP